MNHHPINSKATGRFHRLVQLGRLIVARFFQRQSVPFAEDLQEGVVVGTIEEARRCWHGIELRNCGMPGKEIAANSGVAGHGREAAAGNAVEGVAIEPAAPIRIPYGVFPAARAGREQHFGRAQAEEMVREFNSLRGRLGRMFRGVPIFIGHPDMNRTMYPDDRRLGKLVELRAGADALEAVPEWNSLGEENLREGWWVYPSPVWDAPKGRARFEPDRLLSIGLTNLPRIAGIDPVANAEESNQQNHDMNRQAVCEKLGLPAEATDEEILGAIGGLQEAAGKAAEDQAEAERKAAEAQQATEAAGNAAATAATERDAARERASALEGELAAARENAANTLLDTATADGRITKAQRGEWLGRLTGEGREAAANELAALKPELNTRELDVSRSRVAIGDEAARREAVANAVEAVMSSQPQATYEDAYAQVKRDPKMKPVFEAMRTGRDG